MGYSGFQSNAFQRNAFQIWTGGIVPPTPTIPIGGDDAPLDNYKKRLERFIKASNKYSASKFVKEAKKLVKATPIEAPAPALIVEASTPTISQADREAYLNEILRIISYLDNQIALRLNELQWQREMDELALLLMI